MRSLYSQCLVSSWHCLEVSGPSVWSDSRPVALWCFLALRYCVGCDSWAFGEHQVSGSLKGAMRARLTMLVVLLCPAHQVFSGSLHFLGSLPLTPFFSFILLYFFLLSTSQVLNCSSSATGAREGAWCRVFLAGLLAGLQVRQAIRCSSYLGLRSAVLAPHVPDHPTAICDKVLNSY